MTIEYNKLSHLPMNPFPYSLIEWGGLGRPVIEGDVCNLDPAQIAQMPINRTAVFAVKNDQSMSYFQVSKAESIPFLTSVKFVPGDDPRYKLEANIYRPEPFMSYFQRLPSFRKYIKEEGNILRFDLVAQAEGIHHPAIRASKFIPWTLQVFHEKNIHHCVGEWEPGTANHTAYYRARAEGASHIEAIQSTWTYRQYAQNGFGRICETGAISTNGEMQSPEGYPDNVVYVMFQRDSKI